MSSMCRSVELGLRIVGLWPGTTYAILRRSFYILSMVVIQTFQYQHVFLYFNKNDLSLFMDVLSMCLCYSLLFAKMIIFILNVRLLEEIVACMVEDWKERDVSEKRTMTRMAYISRRYSNFIIASNATAVLLYVIGTLLRDERDTRELILKMELPFSVENLLVYIAVLITQFVHQISAASLMGVLDSLLIIVVFHVCGQIDIVRRKLNEMTQNAIERGEAESIIKTLITQHQRIIHFSKKIETFFSNIALTQFTGNIILNCCLGFLIVISIGAPDGSMMLIKVVLFYIVISLQAFIFCSVGEYLSTKSKTIGDSTYDSLWYNLKPTQNRAILFIILRSQKHLSLTAGKIMDLSLQQFANIMKVSASYVSVLHAMY